jgi:hypothetical protein
MRNLNLTLAIEYVLWDMDDEPSGNVRHIQEHGLSKEDVEDVLYGEHELEVSRSSGRPIAFGMTSEGLFVCVVFDWVNDNTVIPITAYPVE